MSGSAGEKTGTQAEFLTVPSRTMATIRLRDLYDPKPQAPKAPVRIRPPAPRPNMSIKEEAVKRVASGPPTKTAMRKRAQSLPSRSENKKELRRIKVRFMDALGLDLEEVKVFRVEDHPQVPQHVMFRLMMNSEFTFGKAAELSLPYFRPCFPENLGAQPDFLKHLYSQRVCLEQVVCSELGITGTVQVLNLDYEKEVRALFSFTNWRSHRDTTAAWVSDARSGDTDVFRFHLPVPTFLLQPGAILEFAICYRVKGCDYWDNNNGNNYKLSCHSYKVTVPRECEDSLLHFT